jgi:hypothetical protein
MRRRIFGRRLGGSIAAAAGAALLIGAAAPAGAYMFTIDEANSSVRIMNEGSACLFSECGIEADLATGFGGSFELDHGESASIDFLTFTAEGTGNTSFDIEATLAFSTPEEISAVGSGGGGAFTFAGRFVAGDLYWTDMPSTLTLADGTEIAVDFQGGAGLIPFAGSVTTGASVSVGPAPAGGGGGSVSAVPLPAPVLLLASALGVFVLAGARRRQAA